MHEVNILDQLLPEPGAFCIIDRGFLDFERLYRFHEAGSFFVTRDKSNLKVQRRYSHLVDRTTGLMCDQSVVLTGFYSRQGFEAPLRRIRFKDPETGKTLIFLTNNFALPALTMTKALKTSRPKDERLFSRPYGKTVFFENLGKGLYNPVYYAQLIQHYIEKDTAPAAWKSVMALMVSHASVAAPLQGMTEISVGVLLLLGLFTRPVALVAFGFLASLWVSEWGTSWIWELLVPVLASLALAIGSAGRTWGIDSFLARRRPNSLLW